MSVLCTMLFSSHKINGLLFIKRIDKVHIIIEMDNLRRENAENGSFNSNYVFANV